MSSNPKFPTANNVSMKCAKWFISNEVESYPRRYSCGVLWTPSFQPSWCLAELQLSMSLLVIIFFCIWYMYTYSTQNIILQIFVGCDVVIAVNKSPSIIWLKSQIARLPAQGGLRSNLLQVLSQPFLPPSSSSRCSTSPSARCHPCLCHTDCSRILKWNIFILAVLWLYCLSFSWTRSFLWASLVRQNRVSWASGGDDVRGEGG